MSKVIINNTKVFSTPIITTAIIALFKVSGILAINWIWVFFPIWIFPVGILAFLLVVLAFAIISGIFAIGVSLLAILFT